MNRLYDAIKKNSFKLKNNIKVIIDKINKIVPCL